MKTACIYHSIDLDGWMSAAEVIHHFEKHYDKVRVYDVSDETTPVYYFTKPEPKDDETLVMIGYNYGDPIPDLSEYERVIMCDISFPKETMIQLWSMGQNFIWIDHNISAINEMEIPINGLQDTSFAACELTWHYFFPSLSSASHWDGMPEIVRLLGRYDCFGHKGTDEEQKVLEFQYGARQLIDNYDKAYKWLVQSLEPTSGIIDDIQYNGGVIYQYLCTEAKQVYKNGFEIEFKDYYDETKPIGWQWRTVKFICINKERFNPINFGINYHEDGYDGCACFYRRSDGKWSFSLYNDNGKVDCSVIAKQFGGGGNKGAAGFVVTDDGLFSVLFS